MEQSVANAVGRTARIVLLLATAFGLALMHTLGHSGVRPDAHPHPTMAGMTALVSGAAAATLTAADPCPGGHCDGHGGHGSGGWTVCLAILAGLAAIVLLMVLSAIARGRRSLPAADGAQARLPRAPPDRPAGLTLASAAVLRI